MSAATMTAFALGVAVGAVAPPLLLWALFRYDARVIRRRFPEDHGG